MLYPLALYFLIYFLISQSFSGSNILSEFKRRNALPAWSTETILGVFREKETSPFIRRDISIIKADFSKRVLVLDRIRRISPRGFATDGINSGYGEQEKKIQCKPL